MSKATVVNVEPIFVDRESAQSAAPPVKAARPWRALDELIAETEADPVRGPRLREARERLKREGIGPITVVDLDWLPDDGTGEEGTTK